MSETLEKKERRMREGRVRLKISVLLIDFQRKQDVRDESGRYIGGEFMMVFAKKRCREKKSGRSWQRCKRLRGKRKRKLKGKVRN